MTDYEMFCKYLSHDPENGVLKWKERNREDFKIESTYKQFNEVYANTIVGSLNQKGYLVFGLKGRQFKCHRVLYITETNLIPDIVDHINGIRDDNRFLNLRDVCEQDNSRNRAITSRNSSGFCGVGLDKKSGKYRSTITIDRKKVHLGSFVELEDAIKARIEANIKYGFHENHGRV